MATTNFYSTSSFIKHDRGRAPILEEDLLLVGRVLRAWPPPLLTDLHLGDVPQADIPAFLSLGLAYGGGGFEEVDSRCLSTHARALGLPAEAAGDEAVGGERSGGWSDAMVCDYFRLQQQKMAAFASGRHKRLGAASLILDMSELVLLTIAEEVLGVWGLQKLWPRDAEGKRLLGGSELAGVEEELEPSEDDM
jgi:hypothetical protein